MNKMLLDATIKSVEEEGTFEVVASSGKVDRVGDTIDPKGWYLGNYKKNPVMLWAHNQLEPPIARADKIWIQDDKELRLQGHFADTPFAQQIKSLVQGGFLNSVSVGFMPLVEDEKGNIDIEGKSFRRITEKELDEFTSKGMVEINGKRYVRDGQHFTNQELLEVSWVNVPALASALVTSRKMNYDLVTKELESMQKEVPACEVDLKDAEEVIDIKPYPNEHACRIKSPDDFDRLRRKNCFKEINGKCVDYIFGIKDVDGEEKVELQAMRFKKDDWDKDDAEKACKDAGGTFEPASEENALSLQERVEKLENDFSNLGGATIKQRGEEPNADSPKENKGCTNEEKIKGDLYAAIKLLRMADKVIETLLVHFKQLNKN